MQIKVHVKPAKGLKIRMPDNPAEHLPADGALVPHSQFWMRRLADGSVEPVKPAATAPKKGGK